MAFLFFPLAIFALLSSFAPSLVFSYDSSPLDDFCVAVADSSAAVFVNGKICKDPKLVNTEDFYLAANFHKPGNTSGSVGSAANFVGVHRFPALNTLGISMVRADYAPNGFIPPHTHPRATELVFLLEGSLYVGFVGSAPGNNLKKKLYAKVLNPGDIFVVPQGLIHFQLNVGKTKAVAFAAFNSQNAGVVLYGNDLFATEPLVSPELLAKAFQLDQKVVQDLQSRPWPLPNAAN